MTPFPVCELCASQKFYNLSIKRIHVNARRTLSDFDQPSFLTNLFLTSHSGGRRIAQAIRALHNLYYRTQRNYGHYSRPQLNITI